MKRIVVAALAVCALSPASASAAKYTLGSSLAADATIAESHPRDWAAYSTAQAGGGDLVVKDQGEVSMAQLKGSIVAPQGYAPPDVVMHVVVMRPQPDGTDKLMVATDHLPLPFGGDPNQVNTYQLQQGGARICVEPGDHVALATSGGFGNTSTKYGGYPGEAYADGAQFRMFGDVPGSAVARFEQPDGDDTFQVNNTERFSEVRGRELLMRVTVGTGPDARWWCRTAEEKKQGWPNPGEAPTGPSPALNPVTVPKPAHDPHVSSNGTVPIRVYCRARAGCKGTLVLKRKSGSVVGTAQLDIPTKTTGRPRVKLARSARRKLRKRNSTLSVSAEATVNGYTHKQVLRLVRKGK